MDNLELICPFLKNYFDIHKILKLSILKFFYLLFINIKLINLIFLLSIKSKRLFDSFLSEFNKGLLPLFKFPNSYFRNLQSWITLKDLNLGLISKLKES